MIPSITKKEVNPSDTVRREFHVLVAQNVQNSTLATSPQAESGGPGPVWESALFPTEFRL